ncbi:beta-lactamase family protein [Muricauda sp. 2012CJ35-5]|uniref:Beta-lactamase family protein n=1 Tax=Flagellimonas spongiicola TaxID=2942208 RepID=A0ABT0PT40_9FLAO|nr:serine hydrolase domain-containing protein [Allomuricauda spongiicola]MCL6274548.1 beta-lactamase family protein [Allomuricauda spongiicola]
MYLSKSIVLILLLTCFSWSGHAQVDFENSIRESFATFETQLVQSCNSGTTPAVQVSIRYKNGTYHKTLGYANHSERIKASTKTLFRNASTGKVFLAFAALKLGQQGKLDLDTGIASYLKGLHPRIGALTTRQLLTHTAGLKDDSDNYGPTGRSRQIEMLKKYGASAFIGDPDLVFSYSNNGYDMAGAIIEAITGLNFNEAMQQLVFQPLQMNSTFYGVANLKDHQLAYGHSGSNHNFNTSKSIADNANGRASGMAFTTAVDLNKFLFWLNQEHPEKKSNDLRKQLLQIYADKQMTGEYWAYGYGLFHSEYCKNKAIWHSGGLPGYNAAFLSVPESEFSIVVLANGSEFNQWEVITNAVKTILKSDCTPVKSPTSKLTEFTETEANDLVGTYSQGIGAVFKISKSNKQLVLSVSGDQSHPIRKNSNGDIVVLEGGKPIRKYTVFKNRMGQVRFLHHWVRAYPKLKN